MCQEVSLFSLKYVYITVILYELHCLWRGLKKEIWYNSCGVCIIWNKILCQIFVKFMHIRADYEIYKRCIYYYLKNSMNKCQCQRNLMINLNNVLKIKKYIPKMRTRVCRFLPIRLLTFHRWVCQVSMSCGRTNFIKISAEKWRNDIINMYAMYYLFVTYHVLALVK